MNSSFFHYITIGYDCSPANVLREMKLRQFALPFDWVQSDASSLIHVLEADFLYYHSADSLAVISGEPRVVNKYGIQFPHDYPTKKISENKEIITENWKEHIEEVASKYQRRIERFRMIMADKTKPIIVLYRGILSQLLLLKEFLHRHYGRTDLIFVVAVNQTEYNIPNVVFCNPEKNGNWNETAIWKEAILAAQTNYYKSKIV